MVQETENEQEELSRYILVKQRVSSHSEIKNADIPEGYRPVAITAMPDNKYVVIVCELAKPITEVLQSANTDAQVLLDNMKREAQR